MQAITQTADDGMYVITRGCSQMSRVPQKINNIVEIFSFNGCRLRMPNVRGEGGRLNADKGGGGSKIGKNLRTSFMYDPYTHYSTAAPQTTKDSLIRSLTRRAYNICSLKHLDLELTHVRSGLLDNGYPLNHINLIMHRTNKSLSKPKPSRTKDYYTLAIYICTLLPGPIQTPKTDI